MHKKPDPKHRVYRKARIPKETLVGLEALLLALMLGLCAIPCYFMMNFYDGTVPITNRKRMLFLPLWLDQLVGRYTLQVLGVGVEDEADGDDQTNGDGKGRILRTAEDHRVAHIEAIFDRIVTANHLKKREGDEEYNRNTPEMLRRFQGFEWRLSIVDKESVINAMCVPGGKMVIFTGILQEVVDCDDECAAIISHEIGHALCRHGMEAMQWRLMWIGTVYLAISMMGVDLSWLVDRLLSVGVNMLLQLPMSRRAELEADEVAIHLMEQSGYDLDALVSVMRKLGQIEDRLGKMPEVISTHPLTENRVLILKQKIAAKRESNAVAD